MGGRLNPSRRFLDPPPLDVACLGVQVVCQLGDQRLETDTHFRAKNGKASWNWRLKFPVTLSANMKYQRLNVQALGTGGRVTLWVGSVEREGIEQ